MDDGYPESGPGLLSTALTSEETNTSQEKNNDIGDFTVETVNGCQTRPESDTIAAQTPAPPIIRMATKENQITDYKMGLFKNSKNEVDDYCKVKLHSLIQLKDSTKKLLCLIEDLQIKAGQIKPVLTSYTAQDITIPMLRELTSHVEDLPVTSSLKQLEEQIKDMDKACIGTEHNCSIYERLTGKCTCLNRHEYNDLTIHFNEETKYSTSNLGEVIKNIRILKKFLYMGSSYTKNALMFLNEGLTKCPHKEKIDVVLACSHADICNVFDDESFVKVLIRTPMQYPAFGDSKTQSLAARVLYRIAVVEEGRRYLNFNSKIPNDIKQTLRKLPTQFNSDTTEFLNSTLNLLSPSSVPQLSDTYYCKADEGMANIILNSLLHFRMYMTLQEILTNLEFMNKLCDHDKCINDIRQNLKRICNLFKQLLVEYNNSEMNILITSIMTKIMKKPITDTNMSLCEPKSYIVTDTATEPTEMKNQSHQAPSSVFKSFKNSVKSRLASTTGPNRIISKSANISRTHSMKN